MASRGLMVSLISCANRILDDAEYNMPSFKDALAFKADPTVPIPSKFPSLTEKSEEIGGLERRYAYTPMYPGLISNIEARVMAYSQEPLPEVNQHGIPDPVAPALRTRYNVREYIESLLNRKGYSEFVEYNTTLELANKIEGKWVLTLRKQLPGGQHDYWWQESFDNLVVASGHYSIPQFPTNIKGLEEFEEQHPGSVLHSKQYRGPKKYRGKVNRAILDLWPSWELIMSNRQLWLSVLPSQHLTWQEV